MSSRKKNQSTVTVIKDERKPCYSLTTSSA